MSLAPQRPNYVLVWIGIVMLTFSMVGQWLLSSDPLSTTNRVGSSRFTMDYEDSAILPVHDSELGNSLVPAAIAAEDTFDQMVPLKGEEISRDEISLANQEVSLGPDSWTTFPLETVEQKQEVHEDENLEEHLVFGELPSSEPQEQLHAFKLPPSQESTRSRKQRAKDRYQNDGQYNSRVQNRGLAHNGKKKVGSDRSILVKSKFSPRGNGRIGVRFFLENPRAPGRALDRLQALGGEEDTRLALMAETYLAAMEEVILEDDSGQDQVDVEKQELKLAALQRLSQMKSKIRERLQQRPGGIELLAELSPEQLEALLQKLSAQNPRFRALVSS